MSHCAESLLPPDDALPEREMPFPESGVPAAPETPPPPVGTTPPETLAAQAAEGKRGAAWRLFHWIAAGNREEIEAVWSLGDSR